jgi:hypothetical protein
MQVKLTKPDEFKSGWIKKKANNVLVAAGEDR